MDVFVFDLDVHTLIATMNQATRWITLTAGLLGFTGVAFGAFGAHALKDTLTARGTTSLWQTAGLYHLLHSVALVALSSGASTLRNVNLIALCWTVGVVLFSGSLYWLALGGPTALGPVTPLGGLALLTGWAAVAWQAWKSKATA